MFPTEFHPSCTAKLIAKMPTSHRIIESATNKAVVFCTSDASRHIHALAKAPADLKASINATRQYVSHATLYFPNFEYTWVG